MSKTKEKKQCLVPSCDSDAYAAGLCKACYSGMYYWKNRTPGDVIKRMRQVQRLQDRMEMLTPNVRTLPRRKKKGAA